MNLITGRNKKGRKYEQVLDGARRIFMSDGFEGASVDKIAKSAGVSKATLYSYFPDKKSLFTEVARTECSRQADAAISAIDMTAPIKQVLSAAGNHMIRFFISDFGQRTFRTCVGETDRFPELGHAFYKSGPMVVRETLVRYFEHAITAGELQVDDKDLAASQFAELCKADVFLKIVFGIQKEFTKAETDRIIDGAVDMFLARYGAKV